MLLNRCTFSDVVSSAKPNSRVHLMSNPRPCISTGSNPLLRRGRGYKAPPIQVSADHQAKFGHHTSLFSIPTPSPSFNHDQQHHTQSAMPLRPRIVQLRTPQVRFPAQERHLPLHVMSPCLRPDLHHPRRDPSRRTAGRQQTDQLCLESRFHAVFLPEVWCYDDQLRGGGMGNGNWGSQCGREA